MSKNTAQTPPQTPARKRMPLFIIKMMLFAALIMLGLSFAALKVLTGGDDVIMTNATALVKELGETGTQEDITMILLGDSRARYAWRLGDTPKNAVALPDGRTLRSVKLSHDNGTFRQFAGLEETILAARPDVLAVQKSLLFRHPQERSKLSKLRQLPYLMAFKLMMFGDTGQREWEHQHAERICTRNFSRIGFEHRMRTHFMSAPPDFAGELARETHAFLQRMLDADFTVAILRIPPNEKAAEKLGVAPIKLDNIYIDDMPTRETLAPGGLADKLVWLDYPLPEDRRVFCDYIHMDESGSETFAAWLKGEIVRAVN